MPGICFASTAFYISNRLSRKSILPIPPLIEWTSITVCSIALKWKYPPIALSQVEVIWQISMAWVDQLKFEASVTDRSFCAKYSGEKVFFQFSFRCFRNCYFNFLFPQEALSKSLGKNTRVFFQFLNHGLICFCQVFCPMLYSETGGNDTLSLPDFALPMMGSVISVICLWFSLSPGFWCKPSVEQGQ